MRLSVIVTDATSQKTESFQRVVDGGTASGAGMFIPAPAKEIGHAEGWAFVSGDTVEISCAGYDPIKRTVP